MKKDLESIFRFQTKQSLQNYSEPFYFFRRLKVIKQKMNKQMPEACEAVMGTGTGTEAREEDDEYDEAIRRRRRQQVRGHDLHKMHYA